MGSLAGSPLLHRSSTEAPPLESHIQFCSTATLGPMHAVHVTLELASNTVFQSLQDSTRHKHIWVVFTLLLRELPVKHLRLILREKKRICLLSSNKYSSLLILWMFWMTIGVKACMCACISLCVFGLFLSFCCGLEWTGFVSVWTDKRKLLTSLSYHSAQG